MIGPLPMTPLEVSRVPREPGTYVLGNAENRALFIGRADVSLQMQLQMHWLPNPPPGTVVVQKFWYQKTANSHEAYVLECQWYHEYSPTHNAGHPKHPHGICLLCGR